MIAAACIVVAALIVLCALETAGWAFVVGRYKRATRSYTNLTTWQPPVPDTDRDWLSIPPLVFPADVTLEALEQYAAAIEQAAIRAEFVAIVCEHFPYDRDKFPA